MMASDEVEEAQKLFCEVNKVEKNDAAGEDDSSDRRPNSEKIKKEVENGDIEMKREEEAAESLKGSQDDVVGDAAAEKARVVK